jgi:hypothetical protein
MDTSCRNRDGNDPYADSKPLLPLWASIAIIGTILALSYLPIFSGPGWGL